MAKMSEEEFLSNVNQAEADAINVAENRVVDDRLTMEFYLSQPNGYEEDDRSRATSSDVFDTVEEDMPELVKVFLSDNNVMEFVANTNDPRDIQIAQEKTQYVHHIIKSIPKSFKITSNSAAFTSTTYKASAVSRLNVLAATVVRTNVSVPVAPSFVHISVKARFCSVPPVLLNASSNVTAAVPAAHAHVQIDFNY